MKHMKKVAINLFLFGFVLSIFIGKIYSMESLAQTPQSTCYSVLANADKLYSEGDRTAAEKLYRQCKQPFASQDLETYFPEPITDPTQLRPGAQVYWREAQQGLERGQESRTMTALNLLTEQVPDFVPAYPLLAQALNEFDRADEAQAVLEQAATLFPYDADIARARTEALSDAGYPMEASMAARLFSMVNPDHPEREEFVAMADENLDDFKDDIKREYLTTGILGAVGNLVFGGGDLLSNAVDSASFASMLFKGEESTGKKLAAATVEEAQANNVLLEDPVVLEYIDTMGQDIADQMGRDEFDYEFYVIADNTINAFALPGGKVFINTGSILAANSEAELAGLVAHEVAHAVLSHGYQRLATDGLLSVAQQALPLGNLVGLASLDFSRDNEKQADILGTRAIAGFGYAADGLRNLFATLNERSSSSQPEYLSTHPAPPSRISYLEALIQQNGYNRYAYEGVEEHSRIQQRIQELLAQ